MTIHLSGAQTGGEFSLIEGSMPPGGDGGLHMHTREDETLHLLEGELNVTIGKKHFVLKARESCFAPRSIPHRLQNLGSVTARAILINTPGTFDEFVRQAGVPLTGEVPPSGPPSPEQLQKILTLAESFGVRVLVPPGPSAPQNLANKASRFSFGSAERKAADALPVRETIPSAWNSRKIF